MSNTVVGLQNQLDNFNRLYLTINLQKTNVMFFRKGGYLAVPEKWVYGIGVVKVTNAYTYLV